MRIENTVEVDAPLERVWALVNDIPRVAPCMPGAALTGVGDDGTYEGTVAVKLGPLRMSYKGKVSVEEVDDANHSARLTASGKDTKGAGTARATVETRLEPAGETHTRLQVTSDVQLTGKVASFGRGGAINDVATRLFGQFADCLRATLETEAPTSEAGTAAAPGAAPAEAAVGAAPAEAAVGAAPAEAGAGTGAAGVAGAGASTPAEGAPALPPEPVAAGDGSTTSAEGATATPTPAAPAPPPATATTTPGSAPTPAPRPVEALDAGSLAGTVLKGRLQALFAAIAGFFRRLFGGRRSSG
jgi:carbon monoxide dehydrogenase subunit G